MYSVYSMYSTGTYIAKITISYCKVHVHKIMWGNNYVQNAIKLVQCTKKMNKHQ